MKNFIALLFASATLYASSSFATTIAPVETLACTRDFNAWGHAGNCACPHATRYENRLGACVQGAPVAFSTEGELSTEVAIGGETTGLVIVDSSNDTYELIVNRQTQAQIDELIAQGVKYRVTGEILEVDGVESGARPTVLVDTIEAVTQSNADSSL